MKTIVIFGYSDVGKKVYEKYSSNYERALFCDNSSKKQGKYEQYEVLSVEEAAHIYKEAHFVIASAYVYEEMKKQLISLGINEKQIISDLPKEILDVSDEFYRKRARTVREKLVFEINIARHCNLNCKSCDHFSPLSPQVFSDYKIMQQDFSRLRDLFGSDGVAEIRILGGEPLLNREITKYFSLCRRSFNEARLVLITNGILLNQMKAAFWDSIIDNNVIVSVTKYPINIDYEKMKTMVMEKGAIFEFFGNSESGRTFWHTPLDLKGKQDPEYSFDYCRLSNWCIQLDRGKLYTCTLAATIDLFNDYFNKDLRFGDKDVIDIYEVSSKDEILEKLAKPMEFCKYCGIKKRTYGHTWDISKKEIGEWT